MRQDIGVAVAAVCKKALAEPADRKDLHQDLCTDLSPRYGLNFKHIDMRYAIL